MPIVDPLTTVALFSGAAALTAALGVLPQAVLGHPSKHLIGWANALAGGLMLGVAYTLLTQGLGGAQLLHGIGAVLGAGFARAAHAAAGTGELDADNLQAVGPRYGYKAMLVDALHAADEGVAIGVAMVISLPLGITTAATLAVHNVPEAMVLGTFLTRRGLRLVPSTIVAVAVNAPQVVLAVVTFTLVGLWPALLPWVTGFAVGALIYRTFVELLPESYRQAGHTSIAMVTLLAMGVVVLLAGAAR